MASQVKDIAAKYCPEAEVYVFGSLVEGKAMLTSDINISAVTLRLTLNERAMIGAEVMEKLDFPPIEIHFATLRKYEKWCKRFILSEFSP